jgi:hypothetical protein
MYFRLTHSSNFSYTFFTTQTITIHLRSSEMNRLAILKNVKNPMPEELRERDGPV